MAAAISERVKRFNIYKFILSVPGILLVYSVIFIIYFLLRNSPNGNEPIFLKIGGLTFRWYGIIITVGVIFAAFTTQFLSGRRGENPDRTWVLLPIVLVSGIIGARTWYVINTWSKYKDHFFSFGDPNTAGVFEIWRGGIAIQGAVVGGIIGLLIYKWLVGLNFLRWADFIAPGLILAQACGRWGNFMNNEAYGNPTSVPWGVKIPCSYRTTGGTPGTVDTSCNTYPPDQLFHPTFLYESVWDYAVFLTLLFAIMKPKTVERWTRIRLRDGDIFFLYMVLYSIGRFVVESLRTDPLYIIGDPVNGGIRSAQALSIIMIFIGAVAFLYRHRKPTPDSEALSVRVRPQPTKRELRQQQLALATAGGSVATVTEAGDSSKVEEAEDESEISPVVQEIEPASEEEAQDEAELSEDEAAEAEAKVESDELSGPEAEVSPLEVKAESKTKE
jgi:phosphatidylglycerol:prolipoprotein diacylglycerol transferase